MDWSLVVSIVSALIALGALWYARKSAVASTRSAQAATRSANTAEESLKIQSESERRAAEAEERNRVVWSLDHKNKSAYALSNNGTDAAYRVVIDAGDVLVAGETEFDVFPAGHAVRILLSRTFQSATDTAKVTWHQRPEADDEPCFQTFPL